MAIKYVSGANLSRVLAKIKTALDGKAANTEATQSASGLMSVADKKKLDGVDLSKYLPLEGGTLTGNLTGKYFTGTWLQTTATSDLGSKPNRVAVLDGSGWIYTRTPDELLVDLTGGAVTTAEIDAAIAAIN